MALRIIRPVKALVHDRINVRIINFYMPIYGKWYPMEPIRDGSAVPIFALGPENVFEAEPCVAETRAPECQCSTAHFLVIAAPRPSGLPDLDIIQAGRAEGRFFLS